MELALRVAQECWSVTVQMAPYLLLGFAMAGLLSAFITPATVERHLGGHGLWPVVKAALLGVPLPLCSCAVIPVTASLRNHGAGKGATLSFLLSTPQTGVDSILVTYSLLGPVFAAFRPVVAFVTGILGGFAADKLDPDALTEPSVARTCEDECCSASSGRPNRLLRSLRHGFVVLPRDIAFPMAAGILIAGTFAAMVPDDFFASHLGTGFAPMLVVLAVSIPVYVCATASVPIAAALMLKGLSPGAALVFLIAGPATNAATLTTLWKILGRRSVAIYLATVAVTALAAGTALDAMLGTGSSLQTVPHAGHHHESASSNVFGLVCAVALLALLGSAVLLRWVGRTRPNKQEPDKQVSP